MHAPRRSARSDTRAGSPSTKQPRPRPGPDALVQGRYVDDPDGGAVLVLQGHQVGEEGHAVDEGLGAVDRIQDPGPTRRARDVGFLFAHDGVVTECLADAVAQQPFGAPVGHRDRRAVVLALDGQVGAAEVPQGQGSGLPGDVHGELDQGRIDGRTGRGGVSVGHRRSLRPGHSGPGRLPIGHRQEFS